jgi:oligogalacturonide lyase
MAKTGVGRRWESELSVYPDPKSGATVHQLTGYMGHSSHFYFTYPCWYDNGKKIVFYSDRENRTNLFGVDLESGEITQLTDFDPADGGIGGLSKNPVREEVYFYRAGVLTALDLTTLDLRPLYTRPAGFVGGSSNATADGKTICVGHYKDLSDRFMIDLGHGYVGFREIWEAHPPSTIYKIPVDGGSPEEIYQEDYWLGHFNCSSKHPNIMTFCHEGPWTLVENRIWGLDLDTGKAWQIRPNAPGEAIGHEYWMPDGEHIGYHGTTPQGPVYGAVKYDNTDQVEAPFEGHCWHFHSYKLELVIGDGDAKDPYLLLWRFHHGEFEGPKVLVWHRGSFHTQRVHLHPCFNSVGTQVIYTADPQGYGQVFAVDVPAWEALPDLTNVKAK